MFWKIEKKNYQNFMAWSYLIIYLKLGLFEGSLSQHFFINLTKDSGVFFGILGLKSLFKTYIDTCRPDKSKFKKKILLKGGYLDAISHRIIP